MVGNSLTRYTEDEFETTAHVSSFIFELLFFFFSVLFFSPQRALCDRGLPASDGTQQRYPSRRYPHDSDLRPTLPAPSACYLLHTGLPKVFSPATANALFFFVVSLLGISVPAAFHQRFRTGYVSMGRPEGTADS
ncbi:UNVERIFIED_CONTAM: hypothetical protein FKN15_049696 [Acipenser sinensis]